MNNVWLSALTGLLFYVSALYASPVNDKTDVIVADEDGIVYVVNVYAVRGVKSQVLGKMLSHHSLLKMPQMFEPVGSILVPTEETEPMDLGDLSDILESNWITVDRIDDENNPTVIEIKLEYDEIMHSIYYIMELQMHLLREGIIINVSKEDDELTIHIELDESVKDIAEHSLRLEALVDAIEDQGFSVESARRNGRVVSITLKVDGFSNESDEEIEELQTTTTTFRNNVEAIESKNERRFETKNGNEVEKNDDKKMHNRIEDADNLDIPLDFITRSDSLNKIRRRRSTCPECRASNLIRQYLNNYPALH